MIDNELFKSKMNSVSDFISYAISGAVASGAVFVLSSMMAIGSNQAVAATEKTIHEASTKKPDIKPLEKLIGEKVKSINTTNIPGMFEVQVENKVAYIDASGSYLITGNMIRVSDGENITKAHLEEINKLDWNTLPHSKAIKITQGQPKLQFAVFTDPDCPYCRKLQAKMDTMKDVEITIFPMPLEQIHEQARSRSEQAMCAADRVAAWKVIANGGDLPNAPACNSGIEDIIKFAGEHHINGTPFIVARNGKSTPGMSSDKDLEAWLIKNSK